MAKQVTRIKILKAAEDLFSKDGYDGVPTKKIASEAGITEMTLFNHFPSKELLYKSVVKERFMTAEIESVFSELTYDDLEQDLKKITARLIENYISNRNILMMRLKEKQSFQDDKSFKLEQDPMLIKILPVFESYEKKGTIKGSGKRAALFFIAAVKGLFYVSLMDDRDAEDVSEMTDFYISTFCHGIIKC